MRTRRLFDTHCHIGLRGDNPAESFTRAVAEGVERLVIIGVDAKSSMLAKQHSAEVSALRIPSPRTNGSDAAFGTAYWTAGIHPHSANRHLQEFDTIADLCKSDPSSCVAVGESGLDFYRNMSSSEDQHESFRKHLRLAKDLDKPIIIHSRDADDAMIRVLREFAPLKGVMHCFSSDATAMEHFLKFGLDISFSGKITYRKRHGHAKRKMGDFTDTALREACVLCPLDRLVIETDAPWLTPHTKPRGTKNEPAFVADVFDEVVRLKGSKHSANEIESQVWRNSLRLFGLAE